MIFRKHIIAAIFVSLLLSCAKESTSLDEGVILARVYDKVLLESQVARQIPSGATKEDSISIRNSFINSWIERQLLVRQAELNLPEQEKDFTLKLEEYKNDLLIFNYQNQLLLEKLDTAVSEAELLSYYEAHKEMFKLADYILKVRYITLDSTIVENKKSYKNIKKLMNSSDPDDIAELDQYAYMHSPNYSMESNWLYLDVFLAKVPFPVYDQEKLLKNRNLIELFDKGSLYLIRILDYQLKDGESPYELEKKNIRRIILNNRKLQFLENLKKDIYNTAKTKQQIEILTN